MFASPGEALDPGPRRFMEQRFGHDFRSVRIHDDPAAAAAAAAALVGAPAFAVGPDIVFARGRYEPGTPPGTALLAHELTHVVQQSSASRYAKTPSNKHSVRFGVRTGLSGLGGPSDDLILIVFSDRTADTPLVPFPLFGEDIRAEFVF